MLAISLGIYLLSRFAGWNVPNWPMKGEWFFDPFSWQLLMAAGLAVGLGLRGAPLPRTRLLTVLSACVVAIGVLFVTDGFSLFPGLLNIARRWADLDKTTLGAGRIVHFCGLAYLVYAARAAQAMRHALWFKPLCVIGRSGLWIFAILSLLAAMGQVLTGSFGHPVLLDIVFIGGGLLLLYGAALLLDARRSGFVPALAGANSRS
jgi:hypothetical protein